LSHTLPAETKKRLSTDSVQVGIRTGHLHNKRHWHYVSRNLFDIAVCLKLDEAMAVFAIQVFLCWLSLICYLPVETRKGMASWLPPDCPLVNSQTASLRYACCLLVASAW